MLGEEEGKGIPGRVNNLSKGKEASKRSGMFKEWEQLGMSNKVG